MKADRADHYLSWVDREIDRVEASAAGWDSGALPVEERMALRLEWDDVVDRYLTVVKAHDAGELPGTTTERLVNISARLAALAPTLEQMRLRRPDAAIVARVRMARAV